ncbi:MAG: TPM domain-containing protein [Firmicutes bacterium]|nr:TPM domain-containing protein [Bacillota bacterium]
MVDKRRSLFLVLAWLMVLILPSIAVAAPDVKFPEPVGLVNDFAGVLTPQEEAQIRQVAEMLWQSNGVELAVVTVLDTSPYDTNTYAFRLFRAWGIGEQKKDNGLLVLLNMEEREIRIEVGTGLEGYVTDAKAGRILDQALPEFRANRYGSGLYVIVQELAQAVREAPGEGKPLWRAVEQMGPVGTAVVSYIGLIIFAVLFRRHDLLYLLLRLPGLFLSGGRGGRGGRGGWGGGSWGGGGGDFGGGRSSGGGSSRKF